MVSPECSEVVRLSGRFEDALLRASIQSHVRPGLRWIRLPPLPCPFAGQSVFVAPYPRSQLYRIEDPLPRPE
eukprot:7749387-Lingulodinium_polyedra.AAC.1